jgi:hypothetical protein
MPRISVRGDQSGRGVRIFYPEFRLFPKFLQGFQIVVRQADVEPLAVHDQSQDAIFLAQTIERGRQLEFTAFADIVFDMLPEIIEYFWFDDVLTEDGQVFVCSQARTLVVRA